MHLLLIHLFLSLVLIRVVRNWSQSLKWPVLDIKRIVSLHAMLDILDIVICPVWNTLFLYCLLSILVICLFALLVFLLISYSTFYIDNSFVYIIEVKAFTISHVTIGIARAAHKHLRSSFS